MRTQWISAARPQQRRGVTAVRKAGNLAAALGIAALGVAAAVLGEAGDAPGLVLVGILLIASGCALGVSPAHQLAPTVRDA